MAIEAAKGTDLRITPPEDEGEDQKEPAEETSRVLQVLGWKILGGLVGFSRTVKLMDENCGQGRERAETEEEPMVGSSVLRKG